MIQIPKEVHQDLLQVKEEKWPRLVANQQGYQKLATLQEQPLLQKKREWTQTREERIYWIDPCKWYK